MEQLELAGELARTRAALAEALQEVERLRRQQFEAPRAAYPPGEIQHRVRNLLAIVRSVFSRTIETADSLEHAAEHYAGRLDTLSRHEVRFLRDFAGTTDLEDMLRDELLRFGFSDGPQISLDGPAVELSYKAAEAMGLAVHELATNSIKFGALASDTGRLDLRWQRTHREGAEVLVFEWVETNVAVLSSAPLRVGFGREYIEEALPYQLDATTSLQFQPGGLHCRIELPLTPRNTE